MHIQYINPGFQHSLDSMMLFHTHPDTPYWTDALYFFFPQVQEERMKALDAEGRKRYLAETLREVYDGLREQLDEKVIAYNEHWMKHRTQIEDALSEAFQLDTRPLFNDVRALITLNPVCPRFLQEHAFDVFYLNSHRGALGISMHEIIHFLWFHVWHSLFQDHWNEYERPHIKWVLSEMVVESMMRDERLSSINPYFPRENGGCVYRYFQDMVIEGKPILDTIEEMYRCGNIADFMRQSYQYCLQHEKQIQAHIARAEQVF